MQMVKQKKIWKRKLFHQIGFPCWCRCPPQCVGHHVGLVGHLVYLHVGHHAQLHVGHFFCQPPCRPPCWPPIGYFWIIDSKRSPSPEWFRPSLGPRTCRVHNPHDTHIWCGNRGSRLIWKISKKLSFLVQAGTPKSIKRSHPFFLPQLNRIIPHLYHIRLANDKSVVVSSGLSSKRENIKNGSTTGDYQDFGPTGKLKRHGDYYQPDKLEGKF